MIVLAGDIGGTKTAMHLARVASGTREVLHEHRYASADYAEFEPLALQFAAESFKRTGMKPDCACFGVAGPVAGRHARTTNLPWKLDAAALEAVLGVSRVRLINDFQAAGYGIEALGANDLVTLQAGSEELRATRAVIGAGTGLGEGILVWQGDHYETVASEGGHADFSPANDEEIGLLRFLQRRVGRVCWEHVVSGPGLVNIFEYLVEEAGMRPGAALQAALRNEDRAAAIGRFGLDGTDAAAAHALKIFVSCYGAQAGNLALTVKATGGVYVAGGIAAKMLDRLTDGAFMRAFCDKDASMQPLLAAMPVKVVVNPDVGLLGATLAAMRA